MLFADVAVVGAGPAGTAAATELARAGRDVVVVDKARFPRDKCCGDGLTTGALRRLERLGLDPRAVPSWQEIDACWVRSPSGRTIAFPFPSGFGTFGVVARRVELDAALLDVARSAGAKVHDGHPVHAATRVADGVVLEAEGLEPVAARYVIGADGMWSPLRKALGDSGKYLGEWHAFRQYFRGTGPLARRLWVWFEPDLLPGYLWSFPLPDGRANVGFGVRRRAEQRTRSMAEQWRSLLARSHLREILGADAVPEGPHKAWPIPAGLSGASLTAAGGRVLFVGDAARAADPMTGEGIGQALETGSLAATAISAAGPRQPELAAARYTASVRRGMGADHRLAQRLSAVMASSVGARGAIRLAGATAWTRRNFARWLFEDYPRAILATPARWHEGMLTGPGAFR